MGVCEMTDWQFLGGKKKSVEENPTGNNIFTWKKYTSLFIENKQPSRAYIQKILGCLLIN